MDERKVRLPKAQGLLLDATTHPDPEERLKAAYALYEHMEVVSRDAFQYAAKKGLSLADIGRAFGGMKKQSVTYRFRKWDGKE